MPRSSPLSWQQHRALKGLQPAPPRIDPPPPTLIRRKTSFLDLPAELRLEIYFLVLRNVTVHIVPETSEDRHSPHALLRTSNQIRAEVLPILHSICPIRATITDFDFRSILTWLSRIPPEAQVELTKNEHLIIRLHTTHKVPGDLPTLRRWLHDRADPFRPQPQWKYTGGNIDSKIVNDLRRRTKRMKEEGKKAELKRMLKGLGIVLNPGYSPGRDS